MTDARRFHRLGLLLRGATLCLLIACDPSELERDPPPRPSEERRPGEREADAATEAGKAMLDASAATGGSRSQSQGGSGGRSGRGGRGEPAQGGASGAVAGREPAHDPPSADVDAGGDAAARADGSAAVGGSVGSQPVLPADAILWFRADEGVELDADGKVATWSDQSGQKRDAHPPSAASAPKPMTVDSRVWLEFSGAQELEVAKIPPIPQLSIFVAAIARDDGGPRCPSLVHFSNLSGGVVQANIVEFGRHQSKLYYQSSEEDYVYADRVFPLAAPHVVALVHGEDRVARMRLDGTVVAEHAMPLPGVAERAYNFIGDNRFYHDSNTRQCDPFVGAIGEILVFPRALSEDEAKAVEHYLQTKWRVAP